MLTQEILFGVTGQTLFYDPPEGRPSGAIAVTAYVVMSDDDGPTVAMTTGACSVDSVNTTLAQAAVAGATSLVVADATGITRKRRYLLVAANGDQEEVRVLTINGTTIGLRQPIQNAYANTTTAFQGYRISINIDSTWAATKTNVTDVLDPTGRAWLTANNAIAWIPGAAGYRLRWSYTVGGANTLGVSYADLVRYQAKNLVSPLEVDLRFPGWLDRLPTDYQEDQGVALIDEAFRAVKMDALGDDQVLRRLRNTEVVRELVIYRANLMSLEASAMNGNGGIDAASLKLAVDLYQRRYDQLIREPKVPVDQMGGGAAMDPVRLPISRR